MNKSSLWNCDFLNSNSGPEVCVGIDHGPHSNKHGPLTFPTWTSRPLPRLIPVQVLLSLFLSRLTMCLLCPETVPRLVGTMVSQIRCVLDPRMRSPMGQNNHQATAHLTGTRLFAERFCMFSPFRKTCSTCQVCHHLHGIGWETENRKSLVTVLAFIQNVISSSPVSSCSSCTATNVSKKSS